MSAGKKPSTELDALLQRSGGKDGDDSSSDPVVVIDDEQPQPSSSLFAPQHQRANLSASERHRKAYSIDVGSALFSSSAPPQQPKGSRHRKQKSSISQLYESLAHNMDPIREDFESTIQNLKETFDQELKVMDRGETGFLDMSMNRNLSIIPDDILIFGHEAGIKEADDEVPSSPEEQQQSGPPIVQLLFLLGAVAGISSNSTALHMLDGVTPPLKLYWRMTASYVALLPMAVRYLQRDGIPKLSFAGWTTFASAVLCFSFQNCLFYSSLDYTAIGNAVIYANSQALLLIIGKLFVGERIHWMEGLGVLVAFSGAIFCSKDSEDVSSERQQEDNPAPLAIMGDGMALASAVLGVFYLTFAKSIRSDMSVTVFIFSVMFFGSFVILIFIQCNPYLPLTWDMDIHHGVFGWLDWQRLPILVYLAVICNMIGTMGFVRGEILKEIV